MRSETPRPVPPRWRTRERPWWRPRPWRSPAACPGKSRDREPSAGRRRGRGTAPRSRTRGIRVGGGPRTWSSSPFSGIRSRSPSFYLFMCGLLKKVSWIEKKLLNLFVFITYRHFYWNIKFKYKNYLVVNTIGVIGSGYLFFITFVCVDSLS